MEFLRKISNGDRLTKPRQRGEVSIYFDTVTYIYKKPQYSVKRFKTEALEAFGYDLKIDLTDDELASILEAFGYDLKISGEYPAYTIERR